MSTGDYLDTFKSLIENLKRYADYQENLETASLTELGALVAEFRYKQ